MVEVSYVFVFKLGGGFIRKDVDNFNLWKIFFDKIVYYNIYKNSN